MTKKLLYGAKLTVQAKLLFRLHIERKSKIMTNILFICTGNVSRSAVAECILRTMAEREGRSDITVASAGVQNLYGQSYDSQMIATAAKYGYQMEGSSR